MRINFARRDWLQVCLGCLLLPTTGRTEAIERTAVESTSVASIGYSRGAKALEIEFRSGSIYRYRDVPESVLGEMLRAKSKGRYFTAHIRGAYKYEKTRGSRQ